MSRAFIDIKGQTFGRLTALSIAGKDKFGGTLWHCRCQCGGEKSVTLGSLQNGLTKSCGCIGREAARARGARRTLNDIAAGHTFGSLTVKRPADPADRKAWRCECVCRAEKEIRATHLRTGRVTSCGCVGKAERLKARVDAFSGSVFGHLTVIGLAKRSPGGDMWKCRCTCGKRTAVRASNLKSGAVQSCGCFARQRTRETHARDFTGARIGCVTVLSRIERNDKGTLWLCRCDCGASFSAYGAYLARKRHPQSCGCHRAAMSRATGRVFAGKHGFAPNHERPAEYSIWAVAKNKAKKAGTPWAEAFEDFEGFLAEVGERPSNEHRLVRRDRATGFVPGNLEWRLFPPYEPRGSAKGAGPGEGVRSGAVAPIDVAAGSAMVFDAGRGGAGELAAKRDI